jgi:hypothetical protein
VPVIAQHSVEVAPSQGRRASVAAGLIDQRPERDVSIHKLIREGKHVPDDSLVGDDDIVLSSYFRSGPTTMRQPSVFLDVTDVVQVQYADQYGIHDIDFIHKTEKICLNKPLR